MGSVILSALLLASPATFAPSITPDADLPDTEQQKPSPSSGRTAQGRSPDGKWLSWLAPHDGVLNVHVAPTDKPEAARPVTFATTAPIARYFWSPDSSAILYVQDDDGSGNFRLRHVDIRTGAETSLTSFEKEVEFAQATPPAGPDTQAARRPAPADALPSNLSAYQPVYIVYGPAADNDFRMQMSFKYQIFGNGTDGGESSFLSGIHFGFTQKFFLTLSPYSFRDIDFAPELFYLLPERPVADGLLLGGQLGIRHESNGADGAKSRSLNTLYFQPTLGVPVGDDMLTIGPQIWAYVGSLDDNPDIKRYRGNTGLYVAFGRRDSLRFSATGRMNFGSGKGAVDATISYPLKRILPTRLDFLIFGQAFAGYGETLRDYDRSDTRLRIGIGIVH